MPRIRYDGPYQKRTRAITRGCREAGCLRGTPSGCLGWTHPEDFWRPGPCPYILTDEEEFRRVFGRPSQQSLEATRDRRKEEEVVWIECHRCRHFKPDAIRGDGRVTQYCRKHKKYFAGRFMQSPPSCSEPKTKKEERP